MDEQWFQAYVELIEQLLCCPQGQENELLQANAELVDLGLLAALEQYASHLESRSNRNAEWLRDFASQLEKALEQKADNNSGTPDAEEFFLETLQLIVETQGNPQQIYPVWAQQQAQLNTELLEVMPIIMVQLFEQHRERQASIGADLGRFGNLIQQFPLGTRWLNLELAIKTYELLLQIYTHEAFPVQ